VELGRPVGHERYVARIALIRDALLRHRRLDLHVENVAVEFIHRGHVGGAQVHVMQFEFHGRSAPLHWLSAHSRASGNPGPRTGSPLSRGRADQFKSRVESSNSSSTATARGMIFCSTAYWMMSSSGRRSAPTPKR